MADVNISITSTTRVKSRLGITVTTHDTLIEGLIAGATGWIESYCDRQFLQAIHTQELHDGSLPEGTRKDFLVLRNAPIGSITTVEYKTGTLGSPTWVTLTTDEFTFDARVGILYIVGGVPSGAQNVRVTYVGGYLIDFATYGTPLTHELPYELTEACEKMVVKAFKKRDSEGRSAESFDASSITWQAGVSAEVMQILDNYKRVVIT